LCTLFAAGLVFFPSHFLIQELYDIKQNITFLTREYPMIIKINGSELEFSEEKDVYLGSKTSGQIFKKWHGLEEDVKIGLEMIQNKAEALIIESRELLSAKPD
jgi:hypothetical protein